MDGTPTGTNVHAALDAPGSGGLFSEDDCTIVARYNGGAVPASPAVAPGRIWAHLSCPRMVNESGVVVPANGASTAATCDGEADFVFENCLP